MRHITLFNEACKFLFTRLYEEFPVPLDFDQREIGFYDRFDISDDAKMRRLILSETLAFLREEGFIVFEYYGKEPTIGILQARLTAKGLTKLQRVPDGLKQDSKPLIDQLIEAPLSIGDKTSNAAISTAVRHIVGLILG